MLRGVLIFRVILTVRRAPDVQNICFITQRSPDSQRTLMIRAPVTQKGIDIQKGH